MPSKSGRIFSYDVEAAASRVMLDKGRLWSVLWSDLGIMLLPYAAGIGAGIATRNFGVGLAVFGLGLIAKTLYRYPSAQPAQTTVLDEMRNPYASPLRGKAVALMGAPVGRGVPGYVFGEDMMFQDKTGLIFMDYHSVFSFFGNLFFALKKVKKLLGQQVAASGWFYRNIASALVLQRMEIQGQKPIKSYRRAWSFVWAVVLIVIGGFVAFAQASTTSTL
jgi:hypothetical protein